MYGLIRAALLPAAMLALVACGSPTDPALPDGPYQTAGSVLDSLEASYNSMDLESYLDCFRDDFEYHLLGSEWGQPWTKPWPDGWWGLITESLFHDTMFGSVTGIELTLSGTEEAPWSGDSTGQSLMLPRTFNLEVYIDSTHTMGYYASGNALFICRPDSQGAWYIWQWTDISDIGAGWCSDGMPLPLEASSWSYIKYIFSAAW